MLRAGIVFAGICVSVCTKSRKLLIRNWCKLVGICPIVNSRSIWKLVTFDLDLESYFRIFPAHAIPFATSFLVWRYIFRISRSLFSFKVMVQGQGHGSAKAVACSSKTTGQKLLGLDQNICYNNARSNSELLTFWFDLETYFRIFFQFKL